jgi:hypothetical protein
VAGFTQELYHVRVHPGQAPVGFSGSAQGLHLGGVKGLRLGGAALCRCLPGDQFRRLLAAGVPADYALRNVSSVISGGTPIRTGKPNVPSPRFTYSAAFCKPLLAGAASACRFGIGSR